MESGGALMGATWTKRGKSFRVAIHSYGERRYVTVRSKADAEGLVREIRRQELAGVNVLEAVKSARAATPAASSFHTVKTAVLDFIESQVRAGELRESTALNYRNRCTKWLFPTLGDVPVDRLTREQIGGVIRTSRPIERYPARRHQPAAWLLAVHDRNEGAARPQSRRRPEVVRGPQA